MTKRPIPSGRELRAKTPQPPERAPKGSGLAWLASLLAPTLLLVGVPVLARTQGDAAPGRRVAETRCATCHAMDGNGTADRIPKIAGQSPAYLYRQLWALKVARRASPVMGAIAAPLSDREMADVAAYYASQSIRPDPLEDRALSSRGERVYFARDGMGMTRSCAACHGSGQSPGEASAPMMGGGMMGGGMMGGGMMRGRSLGPSILRRVASSRECAGSPRRWCCEWRRGWLDQPPARLDGDLIVLVFELRP